MQANQETAPAQTASAPSSLSGTGRLDLRFLDGLRAFAALLVILHHAWGTVWPGGGSEAPVWTRWLGCGHTVPVFMVLSGFCLMLPVVRGDGTLRGGSVGFIKKRAFRLVPPYYFALAFSLLLDLLFIGRPTGGFWDVTLSLTWNGLLLHLLLLQNFSLTQIHTINYPLWSLSLEWWICLLFPGLVWAWKRFGSAAVTLFSLAASFALYRVCGYVFGTGFMLSFAGLFVVGMLGGELAFSRRPEIQALRERLPWTGIFWAIAGLAFAAMTGKVRHFSSGDTIDFLAACGTLSLLVLLCTRQNTAAGRFLSHKAPVFVGRFAYSLYLVHAPLLQFMWQCVICPLRLAAPAAFLLLALIGLPLIAAGAYLFHLAFERPFITKTIVPVSRKAAWANSLFWPLLRKV